MSCNVKQYLPANDSPDTAIEELVHLPMNAFPRSGRRPRAFLPPSPMELIILTEEGHQLNLVAYRQGGDFYTELHHRETELRALHTHDGHRNPCSQQPLVSDCHMHFPSQKYPIRKRRSSYAYALDCATFNDTTHSVLFFCAELNITVDAMQLYLAGRRRR